MRLLNCGYVLLLLSGCGGMLSTEDLSGKWNTAFEQEHGTLELTADGIDRWVGRWETVKTVGVVNVSLSGSTVRITAGEVEIVAKVSGDGQVMDGQFTNGGKVRFVARRDAAREP